MYKFWLTSSAEKSSVLNKHVYTLYGRLNVNISEALSQFSYMVPLVYSIDVTEQFTDVVGLCAANSAK